MLVWSEYKVFCTERDKLVLLKNRWDTMTDTMDSCDSESVFYRNILSVNVSGDEIEIDMVGGTSTGIGDIDRESLICRIFMSK